MSVEAADHLARLSRAARDLLARPAERRGRAETALALTALALADRVSAAEAPAAVSGERPEEDRETTDVAMARALRDGAVDTRAPDGAGASVHAAQADKARRRLAIVNPLYLEVLERESGP